MAKSGSIRMMGARKPWNIHLVSSVDARIVMRTSESYLSLRRTLMKKGAFCEDALINWPIGFPVNAAATQRKSAKAGSAVVLSTLGTVLVQA